MARNQSFKNVRTVVFEQDSDFRQNIAMSALKSVQAAMHNGPIH